MIHTIRRTLSQLSIRDRLILTFGLQFVLGLLIIIGIVVAGLLEQSAIDDMEEARTNQRLASTINNQMLEARVHEKDFLLRYRNVGYDNAYAKDVVSHRQYIANIRTDIRTLQTSLQIVQDPTRRAATRDLLTHLEAYASAFDTLVDVDIPAREQTGEAVVAQVVLLNGLLLRSGDSQVTGSIDNLIIFFLVYANGTAPGQYTLTDFSTYHQSLTIQVWDALDSAESAIKNSEILSPELKESALNSLLGLRSKFGSIAADDLKIAQGVEAYSASFDAVEPLILQISAATTTTLDDAEARYKRIEQIGSALTVGGVILASLLGSLAMFGMYRSIKVPLEALLEGTRAIASGQYRRRVPVTSQHELGELAISFNHMTDAIEEHQRHLDAALRTVRESSRLKDEFLAMMSHELRTPLNAIIGFQGILMMSKQLDERDLYRVERTRANAERLLELINAILDISRIESGRLQLTPSAVNIREMFETLRGQMAVLADQKRLRLELMIDNTMPPTLWIDEDALLKIATNLVGNALKFTAHGRVTISVRADNEAKEWALAVSDTGVGIPAHMQEIIFERFRQVDGSSKREYGGTGLGLAIVQQLCKTMDGTVRVSSEPNVGSVFTVTLPLETPLDNQPVTSLTESVR